MHWRKFNVANKTCGKLQIFHCMLWIHTVKYCHCWPNKKERRSEVLRYLRLLCALCPHSALANQFLLRNPAPHSHKLPVNRDPPTIFTPSRVRTESKRDSGAIKRMVPSTTQQVKQNKWRKLENALVFINKSKLASKKRYQPWRRTSKG